jgi:tetrapyrrole methylase family protein / MazG family protein
MSITIVGLGPSGLGALGESARSLLETAQVVIARTLEHPAAGQLADSRTIETCDDLYRDLDDFDAIYHAIVDRVLAATDRGEVVYAVPGSPMVGERTVPLLIAAGSAVGIGVTLVAAPSFLDLVLPAVGVDPITDGLQVLDARDLPDPLPLHVPTVITQVDSLLRSGDVALGLGKTLPHDFEVVILDRLGDPDQVVEASTVADLATYEAGPRTTVFVPRADVGVLGLIATNRILRDRCPWDRSQTHHSLLTHLVEEAYEAADALGRLPVDAPAGVADFGAYAEVEDELGDLLLQVVFHATLAAEAGAFDIDEVAEMNRRKLVRRHPHVFGDVVVDGADEVLVNWERIKQDEKQRASLMDDVPLGMPSIARAVKVQKRAASVSFDWRDPAGVFDALDDEIAELREARGDLEAVTDELGDVLFTVINLARHLRVDPETALRRSVDRFTDRFRMVETSFVEAGRRIEDASDEELDVAWQHAKRATMGRGSESP